MGNLAITLSVAQLPIPLIVVGETMPHWTSRCRFLGTTLSLPCGSGTSTLAGTSALFANLITLVGFARRTASFIVATIMDTTWSATQIIGTAVGGVNRAALRLQRKNTHFHLFCACKPSNARRGNLVTVVPSKAWRANLVTGLH